MVSRTAWRILKGRVRKLVQPQRRCVGEEEHYVEKWGIETKQSKHSELCFVLWFLSISCLDEMTQIQRHYFPYVLHRLIHAGNDKQREGALARLPDARSCRVFSSISWNKFKLYEKGEGNFLDLTATLAEFDSTMQRNVRKIHRLWILTRSSGSPYAKWTTLNGGIQRVIDNCRKDKIGQIFFSDILVCTFDFSH
jgi:hypothetical protein